MNSNNRQFNISRRNSLKFVAGAIGTGILAARAGAELAAPQPAIAETPGSGPVPVRATESPQEALQMVMAGNKRFVENKRQYPNQTLVRVTEVAQTQKPYVAILGCADSRFPAEMIFDLGLGDMFTCRVAGNVATPEEKGSLEFSTAVLGAVLLLVIGHENCGAVKAAIEQTVPGAQPLPGQIGSLTDAIKPAVERSKNQAGDKVKNAVEENVRLQIENLKKSAVLTQRIQENKLLIQGCYYDLDTGVVSLVS